MNSFHNFEIFTWCAILISMRNRPKLDWEYFKCRTTVVGECWIWNLALTNRGYGACQGSTAHKRAYENLVGDIPYGLVVRHKCESQNCCNPAHLTLGTQSDNYYDMPKSFRKSLHTKAGKTYHKRGHGRKLDGAKLASFRKSVGNAHGTFPIKD